MSQIKNFITSSIEKLQCLEDSELWIHENILFDVLKVDHSGVTRKECLYLLLKLLRKGKLTMKNDGVDMKLTIPILNNMEDLSIPNALDFWYQTFRSDSSSKRCKWSMKGNSNKSLKFQILLINTITGHEDSCHMHGSSSTRQRREKTFIGWYNEDKQSSNSFKNNDVPAIVKQFPDLFPVYENERKTTTVATKIMKNVYCIHVKFNQLNVHNLSEKRTMIIQQITKQEV